MLGLGSSLLQGGALRSIVKSGLQLFYKANRTQAPPNSIKDHSRNSNDGILYSGKALALDPDTDAIDYVSLRPSNEMGIDPSGFTFAIWFNADTTQSNSFDKRIFTSRRAAGSSYFAVLLTESGHLKVYFRESASLPSTVISTNYRDDNWHRLVISAAPTAQYIYVDNELVGTATHTLGDVPSSDLAYLGAGVAPDTSTMLKCKLSDFQIYDKVWNYTDVKYDWENPDKDVFDNSNSSIVATDCKSLLRLNEGAGDRVYDAAPVLREELNNLTWTANGDWSINGDIASNDGGGSTLTNDILELGKTYQFKCKLYSYTSGEFSLYLGISNESSRFSGTNEFTFIGVCTGGTIARVKAHNGNGSLLISSLTIKEIKPAESFAIVGDKTFVHQQPSIPQYAMSSFSKKMVFDGVNDYVTGSFNGNIGPAKDITFSCWFTYEDSVDSSTDRETLFGLMSSSGDGAPYTKFEVGLFDGNRVIALTGDGSNYDNTQTDASSLSENKLNHVAVSVSSTGLVKIYINGVEANSATHTLFGATTVTHYRIGSRSNTVQLNKGIIDEVSLFDVELTQTEVSELYNSGSSFDSKGHSKYNLDEEVLDGDFPLPNNNWSFSNPPAWSISNNKALYDDSGIENIQQGLSVSAGKTYQLSFDISDCPTSAVLRIYFGKEGFEISPKTSRANGSYVVTFTPSIDDENLTFLGYVDGDIFSLSNVSLKEISLLAYWRNNGADTWTDLSTNSNNGTVNGSPTEIFLQEVPFFDKDSLGMFMNKPRLGGLNFNKSGYVNTGSTFQSTFRDSFSICFWFKFPDGQPSSAMRFFGHDTGEDELFISLEDNGESKFQFRSNNDRVISRTDAAIASNNQTDWIYLTITLTKASTIGDAQIIFYKDGSAVDSSLVGTETLTQANMELYTQNQDLVLGAFNNEGTIGADTCDGIIDDFKIYSKALTAAEISKNYNATKGKHKN